MKYRFSLSAADAREHIVKKLDSCKFSENEFSDKLSYIKLPFSKEKLLVTYKYMKSGSGKDDVYTSAKSYAKLNFAKTGKYSTEVTADIINKRKKLSFSDFLNVLMSTAMMVVTFLAVLALLFENIKNNFWIVAAVFVLAWAYTAFMLSLKQWRDEPKEDPTERIETLLAELFKNEQFCEKID